MVKSELIKYSSREIFYIVQIGMQGGRKKRQDIVQAYDDHKNQNRSKGNGLNNDSSSSRKPR